MNETLRVAGSDVGCCCVCEGAAGEVARWEESQGEHEWDELELQL